MHRPRSLSHQPVNVRRRTDLVAVETRHQHDLTIVIKDPVAMSYHRLSRDEYFVLEQLDGKVSLEELRGRYERAFAPNKVSVPDLNRLLMRLHQCGLTVSDAASQGDRLHHRNQQERRRRQLQHLSSILFIRFPGVDPEPVLRRLYPLAKPLLSRVGLASSLLVAVVAACMIVVHWDRFRSEMPSMQQWMRFDSLLILAAVIGCTKILHELGHALVCKHFGGECHTIGPMLLVFTPALYCDTSDSWMLPSRWQRAAVGMAGMATEVLIASLAAFLWLTTSPGLVHYVAMNVMVVCSVSTVLFNANPLLRYDGYYVLSDLCDAPNLAEESRKAVASTVNRLFFGIDEGGADDEPRSRRFWLLFYGSLAAIYRWALTILILWFVSLALRPYGLESIGIVLCAIAAIGMLAALLRAPIRFLRNPWRRSRLRLGRSLLTTMALLVLLVGMFFPLPAHVAAVGRLVPATEAPVYVLTPGFLTDLRRTPGQRVQEGESLATLVNHDVELQYLSAKGRYETQQQVVHTIRRAALSHPDVANDLPAQEVTLDELKEQFALRQRRREGLEITAPRSGILIEAPSRSVDTPHSDELHGWQGYPSDTNNRGCFLTPGDELFSIVDPDHWEAELLLDQSEVERIQRGARVRLVIDGAPHAMIHGVVREIARSEWTHRENGDRRDPIRYQSQAGPQSTSYAVRVQLDSIPEVPLTGISVTSRIETAPRSLAQRSWHLLTGLFRFR